MYIEFRLLKCIVEKNIGSQAFLMYKFFLLYLVCYMSIFGHGQLDEMLQIQNQKIKQNPNDSTLYLKRAQLYFQHEQWLEALDDYAKVESLGKGSRDLDFNRGEVFLAMGSFEKAKLHFSQSVLSNPQARNSYIGRARANSKLEKHEQACRDYEQGVKGLDRLSMDSYLELSHLYAKSPSDGLPAAILLLEESLNKLGSIPVLESELLKRYEEAKRFIDALQLIDKKLSISIRKEPLLLERAKIYMAMNELSKAKKDLSQLSQLYQALPDYVKARKVNLKMYQKSQVMLKSIEGR